MCQVRVRMLLPLATICTYRWRRMGIWLWRWLRAKVRTQVLVCTWKAASEHCSLSHDVNIHGECYCSVPGCALAKSLDLFEPSESITTTQQDCVRAERPQGWLWTSWRLVYCSVSRQSVYASLSCLLKPALESRRSEILPSPSLLLFDPALRLRPSCPQSLSFWSCESWVNPVWGSAAWEDYIMGNSVPWPACTCSRNSRSGGYIFHWVCEVYYVTLWVMTYYPLRP